MPRSAIRCDARWDHLPFSPAVAAGPFVFVSGQASVDDAGVVVSGPFEDEFRRSWDNVRRVLAAAGMTLDHVVKVTSYLARQEDRPEYDRLYRGLFAEPLPARTTLIGCLGVDFIKYEVEVIAHRGD